MASELPSPFGQFVDRLACLSPLTETERTTLLGLNGMIVQARAGIDLTPAGAQSAFAHLVVEGLIGRFAQFSDGKRPITAIHLPGDIADLHAVVRPTIAPALQALDTSTLIRVPIQSLTALARSAPAIAEAFWAYCAVDTAVLERWAANLGRRAAAERLAHFLCEMGLRTEYAGRGSRGDFELSVTQPQLGDALGLTPVHVNRTLKALRTSQLLTVTGRRFQIHDWHQLAVMGDFDPAYLVLDGAIGVAPQQLLGGHPPT